jgi:hypothetical protein
MTTTRRTFVALLGVLLGPYPPAGAQQGPTGKLTGTVVEVRFDGSTKPILGGEIHVSVYREEPPLLIPCMKDTPTAKDGSFSLDVPAEAGLVVVFLDSRDPPKYHSNDQRISASVGKPYNVNPTLSPLSTPMTAPALGRQAQWLSRVVQAYLSNKRSRADEPRQVGPYLEYLVGAGREFPGDARLNIALAASADLLRDPPLAFGRDWGTLYTRGSGGNWSAWTSRVGSAWSTPPMALRHSGLSVLTDGRVAQPTAKEGVLLWPDTKQKPEKPIGQVVPEKAVAVAAVPKGNRVAVADDQGRVTLYAADGARFVRGPELKTGLALIRGLAFSPDGTKLAAVTLAGDLFVWDSGSGGLRLLVPAERDSSFANAVAFSPNSRQLAVTSGLTRPGLVRFVDIESEQTVWARHLPKESGGAAGVVVTRGGTVFTTGIQSGALFAFGAATGEPFVVAPETVTRGAVALSSDGAILGFVDPSGRPQTAPERTLIKP